MIKALLVLLAIAGFYAEVSSAQSCSTLSCPNPAQTFSTSPGFCRAIGIAPSPPTGSGCTTLSNNVSSTTGSFTYNLGVSNLLWTGYVSAVPTSTVVCSITVVDGIAPTLSNTCPSSSSTFTASTGVCTYNTGSAFNSSAIDNCLGTISYYYSLSFTGSTGGTATGSGATFSYSFPVGTTSIYQYARDSSGNTAGCTYSYKVTDNQIPTISCGGSTIGTSNTCGNLLTLAPSSFTDNCATASLSPTPSAKFYGVGTGSLTFTGTDTSGNTASCTVHYTVSDTTAPTVTCPTATQYFTSTCGYMSTPSGASASDNCAVTSSGYSGTNTYYAAGTQLISFNAKDSAGNSASCQQPVFINITASPTFTSCPVGINATASGACTSSVSYSLGFAPTTMCTASGSSTYSIIASQGTGISTTSGVFPIGTTVVTFIGTQNLTTGNALTDTCSFVVFVRDSNVPSISCSSSTASFNSVCGYSASYSYTYSDPCKSMILNQTSGITAGFGGTVSPTTSAASYTVTGVFSLSSPYTTSTSTCSSKVTFTDTTAPFVSCPVGNYLATISSSTCTSNPAAAIATNPPSATDNCTPASYFSASYTPSLTTLTGTLSTTYSAKFTDPSGNTASCSFLVTPVDSTAPKFTTCPTASVIYTPTTSCSTTIPTFSPVGSDNCGTVSYSYTGYTAGTVVYQPGNYSQTVTVTDASGNSNSNCVITQQFVDNVPPVFPNCSSAPIQLCPGNSIAAPTATDNCGSVVVAVTSQSGSTTTYTATDSSGNTATCTSGAVVSDITPPKIVCQSSYSVTLGPNLWTAAVLPTNLYTSVSDNCAFISSVVASKTSFNIVDAFQSPETVTVSATDPSGNVGNCTLPITIQTQPVLVLPGNGTIVRQSTAFTVSWSSIPNLPSGATITLSYTLTGATGTTPSPVTVNYSNLSTSVTLTNGATITSTVTITATVKATVNGTIKTLAGGAQTLQYRAKL